MKYKITGFNSLGEAVIVNEWNEQMATASLYIDSFFPFGGEKCGIEVSIEWDKTSLLEDKYE